MNADPQPWSVMWICKGDDGRATRKFSIKKSSMHLKIRPSTGITVQNPDVNTKDFPRIWIWVGTWLAI